MPKSLDPAKAAAAPETDIVRAIYEGLTELDPRTLKELPAVAERWESSSDLRTWTFYLRKGARWSNGEPVVADDFVRSWKRLSQLKAQAANKYLFENIVGMKESPATPNPPGTGPADFLRDPSVPAHAPLQRLQLAPDRSNAVQSSSNAERPVAVTPNQSVKPEVSKFGVEAVEERILRVTLDRPDKDFAKLVANSVFRPIHGDGAEFSNPVLDADVVTNGPFRITSIADNGISLERSEYYWNRKSVGLDRVQFVPVDTAEKALDAYRAGNIDAVSNADFEPLALKLLTPFEDFRRTTHSALNFYEINPRNAPFNDRRVRTALAISIDRERLTEGELEGSMRPAYSFLPLGGPNVTPLSLDIERAKDLLAKAGFPDGKNFPQIRLVVNRNDTQQRVAKVVARMWKQNLNLDTQVIVKESADMEKIRESSDFDLLRRGVVIPTTDELVSLRPVVRPVKPDEPFLKKSVNDDSPADPHVQRPLSVPGTGSASNTAEGSGSKTAKTELMPELNISEQSAIYDVYAIPLYFPTSYSLVKPYVSGFEMNGLDAPSLANVTIDSTWQP
ncbi:MAG: peptide ABC transporter substrate-binding protein [Acidobacteriota bacterium]